LTDAEVAKSVPRINEIWHKAGIHFGLESIVREPATQVERFQTIVDLNNGQLDDVDYFGYLFPASSRVFDGLHVYILGDIPLNGAYITAADATIVKDKPELRQVKGGSDDPLSRVAARGLAQALGLTSRQDEVGLVSSGTNGIGLNEVEVNRTRLVAATIPGAMAVKDAAKGAEAALAKKELAHARQLWSWLAEVPGSGAAVARKRLADLPPTKP
jgi:hypothetical protein